MRHIATENPWQWECNALRGEVLQNQQNGLHILIGCLAATGTILGFAVQRQDGYLSLIPLVVLVPGLYMWVSQQHSTFRIGAYIRTFIEARESELRYESAWAQRQTLAKAKRGMYASSTLRVFHGLGLLCFILSFSYWTGSLLLLAAFFLAFLVHVVHSTVMEQPSRAIASGTLATRKWSMRRSGS